MEMKTTLLSFERLLHIFTQFLPSSYQYGKLVTLKQTTFSYEDISFELKSLIQPQMRNSDIFRDKAHMSLFQYFPKLSIRSLYTYTCNHCSVPIP